CRWSSRQIMDRIPKPILAFLAGVHGLLRYLLGPPASCPIRRKVAVRKVCATDLYGTHRSLTELATTSNARHRKCCTVETSEKLASHSKCAGLRPLGVQFPLPASTFKAASDAGLVTLQRGEQSRINHLRISW